MKISKKTFMYAGLGLAAFLINCFVDDSKRQDEREEDREIEREWISEEVARQIQEKNEVEEG